MEHDIGPHPTSDPWEDVPRKRFRIGSSVQRFTRTVDRRKARKRQRQARRINRNR